MGDVRVVGSCGSCLHNRFEVCTHHLSGVRVPLRQVHLEHTSAAASWYQNLLHLRFCSEAADDLVAYGLVFGHRPDSCVALFVVDAGPVLFSFHVVERSVLGISHLGSACS